MNIVEWLSMGGYALYVWGSFGMTALCMVVEPIALYRSNQALKQRIARLNRMEAGQ